MFLRPNQRSSFPSQSSVAQVQCQALTLGPGRDPCCRSLPRLGEPPLQCTRRDGAPWSLSLLQMRCYRRTSAILVAHHRNPGTCILRVPPSCSPIYPVSSIGHLVPTILSSWRTLKAPNHTQKYNDAQHWAAYMQCCCPSGRGVPHWCVEWPGIFVPQVATWDPLKRDRRRVPSLRYSRSPLAINSPGLLPTCAVVTACACVCVRVLIAPQPTYSETSASEPPLSVACTLSLDTAARHEDDRARAICFSAAAAGVRRADPGPPEHAPPAGQRLRQGEGRPARRLHHVRLPGQIGCAPGRVLQWCAHLPGLHVGHYRLPQGIVSSCDLSTGCGGASRIEELIVVPSTQRLALRG